MVPVDPHAPAFVCSAQLHPFCLPRCRGPSILASLFSLNSQLTSCRILPLVRFRVFSSLNPLVDRMTRHNCQSRVTLVLLELKPTKDTIRNGALDQRLALVLALSLALQRIESHQRSCFCPNRIFRWRTYSPGEFQETV